MHTPHQNSQTIRIEIVRHTSGLLLGTSPDVPGFSHTAATAEQFEAEIEGAVEEMLVAMGRKVVRVESLDRVAPVHGFSFQLMHATVESEAA